MPEFTEFLFERRVTYSECTVGNHVYYSRYLDLLEEARGEFFRAAGFPLLKLQSENTIFPVIECSLKYLRPARYDDILQIRLWISELGKVRLRFESEIRRSETVILRAMTEHVCTDTVEKPKRIPENVIAALQPFYRPQAPD
jgi:acyl-CoA thioester hydrolase